MSGPVQRPRRLRQHPALRRLVRETRLSPASLVAPLFVGGGDTVREATLDVDEGADLVMVKPARLRRVRARGGGREPWLDRWLFGDDGDAALDSTSGRRRHPHLLREGGGDSVVGWVSRVRRRRRLSKSH